MFASCKHTKDLVCYHGNKKLGRKIELFASGLTVPQSNLKFADDFLYFCKYITICCNKLQKLNNKTIANTIGQIIIGQITEIGMLDEM